MRYHITIAICVSLILHATPGRVQATPWSFVVFGDSRGHDNGVNTQILGEIANQVAGERPDFVLFTGDLVEGYTNDEAVFRSQLTQWQSTMRPVYDAGIGVFPVRGNHEDYNPNALQAWNELFSGRYALPGNGPEGEGGVTYSCQCYRSSWRRRTGQAARVEGSGTVCRNLGC